MPFFGVPIRNGLPIGLGSVAGFGVQQFDPSQLFEGGTVAGAWYDPSDLSTMFTTDAGTTPVAMPGGGAAVSVGRILDKSGNGNHAISFNNTTARPELRARVNLLTYSEEFDNGAWEKLNFVTISQNVAVAPNGTMTADKLIAPNSTGAGRIARQYLTSGVNGVSYVSSFYAKYVSGEFAWVRALATDAGVVWFDIQNGVKGTESGVATGTITPVGNGWYRCSVVTTANSVNIYSYLNPVDADGSTTTTGDGSKGVLIWGADLRPANIGANVPAYQRIADALTYDTSGFPLYLRFDGIDDSMYTPANLNLSGTDKVLVFAGVRKLSDAAAGVIAELSASFGLNSGTFLVMAADSAGANYYFGLNGTGVGRYRPTTYTSPISNVLAASYDIGGAALADEIKPRINGVLNQSNPSGIAGTGNFGTYPLYIGSRNNTTTWFNGHLHGLIVVGSAVNAGNISATENWMAGKTGLVLP